jgi:transmembrane sensor
MMTREKFILLLDKYSSDEISPEERSEFLASMTSGIYDDIVLVHIQKKLQTPDKNTEIANLSPHRSADILHTILSSEKKNSLLIPRGSVKVRILRWTVAAALIVAAGIAAYLFNRTEKKETISKATSSKDMLERANTSAQPLKIEMEEGSIITLQPGSAIHYPPHFLPDKREIFLEGEAFFEVSKNANRPFFVYNKNTVTHVLGTSFNNKLNKETGQVEVSVRSGRVEVYENKFQPRTTAGKKNNGVILLPNQKVTYDESTRQFVPSLVDIPLPITDELSDNKTPSENEVFEETPLKTVFGSLEKSYGIEIMVESENIYKCLFTGDMNQQDLFTRLDVICQSVQASYEVKGTRILIKGKGCN